MRRFFALFNREYLLMDNIQTAYSATETEIGNPMSKPSPQSSPRYRALIVEDNPDIGRLVRMHLRDINIQSDVVYQWRGWIRFVPQV